VSGARAVTVRAPRPTEIVLTRAFDAPRRLVFDALTRPELLRRWFGADGWDLVDCEVDLRVGGRWRFVSRGPAGALMGHGGVYREVVPPERLVYTESYDDQWFPGQSVVIAELTEQGRDVAPTTTLTTTLQFPSREVRDHVLRTPMERGVGEGYDRLARLLRANTEPDNKGERP
jgi:uncharacterized protein YndB with AHSA1/START domain